MADTQWLTQAQYDLLANELKERVEVKRVEIARLIDAPARRATCARTAATTPPATSSR